MSDNIQRTEISDLGEFGLIDHLLEHNVLKQRSTVKGPGDDAAVLDYGGRHVCVSTDLLIEGIHFDMMYTPLKHLGYKAVVVNLSDICAMNAVPTQVTVSLAVSNRYSVEALEELYEGIQAACKFYGVDLIGGDTTASPSGLVISVTAMAPVPQPDRLTFRDGARPGDVLCVTGDLGGAFLGLQILEREKQLYMDDPNTTPDLEGQSYVVGRQLKPEARVDIVDVLRKTGLKPTSMIDVSDGLASDIFHITRSSKVGAVIFEEQVPIHNESKMLALKFNMDPITCALSGGEDYELMFTVSPNDLEKVRMLPDLYIIGEIVKPEHGVKLRTEGGNLKDIKAQGWAHFKG